MRPYKENKIMNYVKSPTYSFLILFVIVLFSNSPCNTGVVLTIDLPLEQTLSTLKQEIKQVIKRLNQEIKDKENNRLYLFDESPHTPHWTLAYLSAQPFTCTQMLEQEPQLFDRLINVAQAYSCFNITTTLVNGRSELWKGNFEIVSHGKKKKNYYNIVLAWQAPPELIALIQSLDAALNTFSSCMKRKFPFTAHVTIGKICEQKDRDVSAALEALQKVLSKKPWELINLGNVTVTSFKLKGHNNSQILFPFAQSRTAQ